MEDLVLAMNPENPGWNFISLNSVRERPVLAQNYSGCRVRRFKKVPVSSSCKNGPISNTEMSLSGYSAFRLYVMSCAWCFGV